VHTLLDLLYVLYWPDDGRLAAETCSPSHELILYIVSLCWYIELCFRREYTFNNYYYTTGWPLSNLRLYSAFIMANVKQLHVSAT